MQLSLAVSRLKNAISFRMSAPSTFALCAALGSLFATASASAQVNRIPLPNNSPFPISQGVWAGNTLYLSGMLSPAISTPTPGDTQAQTVEAIKVIDAALKAQKLTLGDVVMMHVYLAGDPANGGKMDFKGFMAGYTQYFGTKDQPNKPARSAMQVAALAAPTALVEIEVIAVKQ
jgi:enamine deaminase RidA (YjgF/YER057c/UK114 family)